MPITRAASSVRTTCRGACAIGCAWPAGTDAAMGKVATQCRVPTSLWHAGQWRASLACPRPSRRAIAWRWAPQRIAAFHDGVVNRQGFAHCLLWGLRVETPQAAGRGLHQTVQFVHLDGVMGEACSARGAHGPSLRQARPPRPISWLRRRRRLVGTPETYRRGGSTGVGVHRTLRLVSPGKHVARRRRAVRTPGYGIEPRVCTPCCRGRTTAGPGCPKSPSEPREAAALPTRRRILPGGTHPPTPEWIWSTLLATRSPDPLPPSPHPLCGWGTGRCPVRKLPRPEYPAR